MNSSDNDHDTRCCLLYIPHHLLLLGGHNVCSLKLKWQTAQAPGCKEQTHKNDSRRLAGNDISKKCLTF